MIRIGNKRNHEQGIYIGRPSPLGNPFVIGRDGNREEVIRKYRTWLEERIPENKEVTLELNRLWTLSRQQDITLICWCAPQACHGDIIKEFLEGDY